MKDERKPGPDFAISRAEYWLSVAAKREADGDAAGAESAYKVAEQYDSMDRAKLKGYW